jgi:acyl-CoA synthetase (AMP-forming)/AMP-acid ligase II
MTSRIITAPTLWNLLEKRTDLSPDEPMLIETGGRVLSFLHVRDRAESLAAGLHEQGVRSGQVVAWQMPTGVDTVLLTLALARLGVVQNPILHLYRERELGELVRQSQPSLLFVPAAGPACDYPAIARKACPQTQVQVLSGELPAGDPAGLPPAPGGGDTVRWIYCTSGTTSGPKAARHTDDSVMAAGYALGEAMGVRAGDIGSIAYPFAHIGGVMYLTMVLSAGMSAVLVEKFVPEETVAVYRRLGVTHAGGSTAHYQAFLAQQRRYGDGGKVIPSLKMLSAGGASKPAELVYQLQREMDCKVLHAYGMTEAPLVAHCTLADTDEELAHTEGRPVPGMEVRIVREDGSVAGAGETGEIWIRGRSLCKGYLDPEQTAQAFTDEGFYRTGDLGVMRETGHLSIVGRIKDIIIRKGENISAREIEDLLYSHPKVGSVAVIGLPDPASGERVCAVVETEPGAEPLSFGEMVEYLESQSLMRQKIPEQLEIVEALPRNQALNKILKYKLQQQFAPREQAV